MKFKNKSHILTKYDNVVEHHHDQPFDEYEWSFGNGQVGADRNPVVTYPNEGGRFPVTLIASIAEGRCTKDTTLYIEIPAIGDVEQIIDSAICDGSYVIFGRYYAGLPGTYTDSLKTFAGCDSIVSLQLTVNPVTNEYAGDTTICAEYPLTIDNQTYKSKESGLFYRFYKNMYGCDSTLWMDVTVLDSILPDVRVREMSDEPNSGAIYIKGEGFDYYTVNGGYPVYSTEDSLVGLNGGAYSLEFFNSKCSIVREVNVSVCMPGWVYQRWDDVLSLKNFSALETDSITHIFTDYQWYKDNEPIEGANLSYLYVEGGLDPAASYHLEMTRIHNGEKVVTCPFKPTVEEDRIVVYVYPSPVQSGGILTIMVSSPAKATIVNTFGEVVKTLTLKEGLNDVKMDVPAGVYVVQVTINGETRVCRVGVID